MTTYAVLTIATTDDTTTEPDVIAAAETNSVHEVYPEALAQPVDADPVWITPSGAVAVRPEVLDAILEAALVGLEGSPYLCAGEAIDAVNTLRANRPTA